MPWEMFQRLVGGLSENTEGLKKEVKEISQNFLSVEIFYVHF